MCDQGLVGMDHTTLSSIGSEVVASGENKGEVDSHAFYGARNVGWAKR
jgi:hypothetical protein